MKVALDVLLALVIGGLTVALSLLAATGIVVLAAGAAW